MLAQGEQSEAQRRRWKPGQEQHAGPENQDSQHMPNQPRGSFPEYHQSCAQPGFRAEKKGAISGHLLFIFLCLGKQGQEKKTALNLGTRVSLVEVLANIFLKQLIYVVITYPSHYTPFFNYYIHILIFSN